MDDALRERLTIAMAKGMAGRASWRCEEPLRSLLDAWIEELGPDYYPRSATARRALYAATRELLQEIGEEQGPAFIRWAVHRMRQRMLDVKSPRSLLWLIPTWRQRGESAEDG